MCIPPPLCVLNVILPQYYNMLLLFSVHNPRLVGEYLRWLKYTCNGPDL